MFALGSHVQDYDLDVFPPLLADASQEWTAALGALAGAIALENDGSAAIVDQDLLQEFVTAHGALLYELIAAVRVSVKNFPPPPRGRELLARAGRSVKKWSR